MTDNEDEKLSFEEIAHSWEFQNENDSKLGKQLRSDAEKQSQADRAKADSNVIYSGFHVEDWVATMGIWQIIDGAYTVAGQGRAEDVPACAGAG